MDDTPNDQLPPGRSPQDLFSQLLPDAIEDVLGMDHIPDAQTLVVQRLLNLAGTSGGPLEAALREFLNGEGDLHATAEAEATRAGGISKGAAGGGGTAGGGVTAISGVTAASTLEALLINQFHLSPPIARVLAGLLVKLLPATKKTTKKARRKPKPKTTTKPKASAKKPKKKTEAKPKKPVAKRPAAKKPSKKKPAAKRKTRGEAIEP